MIRAFSSEADTGSLSKKMRQDREIEPLSLGSKQTSLSMRQFPFHMALIAASLALASCASEPPPAPNHVEITDRERAASEVHVDPVAAAEMISRYRRDHALSGVERDPVLQGLAQAQAIAMAAHDQLSHEVDGNLEQRLAAAHLQNLTAVENVSAGYFSLPDVVAGWQHSPAHDANLLDPPMRRLGIATAYAPGTRYKVYWALVMSN